MKQQEARAESRQQSLYQVALTLYRHEISTPTTKPKIEAPEKKAKLS